MSNDTITTLILSCHFMSELTLYDHFFLTLGTLIHFLSCHTRYIYEATSSGSNLTNSHKTWKDPYTKELAY